MGWSVEVTDEFAEWFLGLAKTEGDNMEAAVTVLEDEGPSLGRPLVDRVKGSRFHNMKELRPASSSIRVIFAFDPRRAAILLVGGDKAGNWEDWYDENIPIADQRYVNYLLELREERLL